MFFLLSLSLTCSFIYLFMAAHIFKIKKDSILTKLFILSCILMFIWSFSYGFTYITTDRNQIILFKISSFGWCYCPAIFLHLALIFTKNKFSTKKTLTYSLYVPGTLLLFLRLFLIESDNTANPILLNFFYKFDFIYNLLFTSICCILIFITYIKAINIKEKKQAKIIIFTGIFSYISNTGMQYFLSIYGFKDIPQIGHILNLAVFLGIYYAIIYYNLFEISPNLIINDLAGDMLGIIIVLSPNGKILKINKLIQQITGYSSSDLLGKSIDKLLDSKDILTNCHENNFDTGSYKEINCKTKNNEIVPMNISCFPIINKKINEISTILLIGYDLRNIKKLKKEVEEHKLTEKNLRESEEIFKMMFYKHTSIMYIFDPETLCILDANDAAIKFYGYSYEKLKTMKINEINKLDKYKLQNIIKKICSKDNTPYKSKHLLSDCSIRDVEIHATPIIFKDKKIIFSIINDITEKNKKDEYISFLAYHDSLTGLPNRKLFYLKFEQALCQAKLKNSIFAILYIDFDGFKLINDTYGHQIGDFILSVASKKLKNSIRENDIIARIGGDEFIVLLNDIQNYKNAESVVNKLLFILNEPILKNNTKLFIDASIGISLYPINGQDVNSLIQSADQKMYSIKKSKKDLS